MGLVGVEGLHRVYVRHGVDFDILRVLSRAGDHKHVQEMLQSAEIRSSDHFPTFSGLTRRLLSKPCTGRLQHPADPRARRVVSDTKAPAAVAVSPWPGQQSMGTAHAGWRHGGCPEMAVTRVPVLRFRF